jgi:hypothetical protein
MRMAKILFLGFLALSVSGWLDCGFSQQKPLKKIRVDVPSVGMGNIIIFITKQGKLFEKYGLDAEVITVMGSGIGAEKGRSRVRCARS